MRLLLDEFQALPVLLFHLPWPEDQRLSQLCIHLAEQPDDLTTANLWAKHLAMSTKTFHRQFRKHTGITFGQWRQLTRLLLSLESLAEGTPIVQVALEHGYNSQSAYTAMFKRHFGITPSVPIYDRYDATCDSQNIDRLSTPVSPKTSRLLHAP